LGCRASGDLDGHKFVDLFLDKTFAAAARVERNRFGE
jgi:hypothetical protein